MNGPTNNSPKTRSFAILAGLGLLAPAWIGLVAPAPAIWSPLPILTVLPGFLLSPWNFRAAAFVPVLLFSMWNPGVFRGDDRIPKRSYGLLLALTALTGIWFARGWTLGLQYQGTEHTHVVFTVNLIWLVLLWASAIHGLKAAPSF